MRMLRMWSLFAVALWLVACSDDAGTGGNNANGNENANTNGNENANENSNADCGNGVLDAGEECDEGTDNSDTVPDACRLDCLHAHCGDGVADAGESCDGEDLDPTSCGDLVGFNHGELACDATCELDTSLCSECGDGVLDPGEECDGQDLGGQDCASVANASEGTLVCATDCAYNTSGCWECGNGVLEATEACDEGAANCDVAGCTCSTSCTLPGCGDGVLDPTLGEECDEGVFNCIGPGCTCNPSCILPGCGNSMVEPFLGEDCDLGAANCDVAGCTCASNCTAPGCGNGALESYLGEQCDEGPANCDMTGCTCNSICLVPGCGNGWVDFGEDCDLGTANCDVAGCTCASNCTAPGCGNGVVEGYLGEACDEGASNCDVAGCTCSTTCTAPPPPGDACGYPQDGVWFEIDYSSASTATNPAWTFSNTPGWTGQDWAPNGSTWPEVWDVYNNISVGWDPVGSVLAEVDGGTLQIMLGLAGLTSYSYASVCVEGRSVSATSSVTFDVYNPLNGCGNTASMSHDWLSFHPTGIDLGTCLIPNDDFQAVRIEPSGGSGNLGVIRVSVILHDAVY